MQLGEPRVAAYSRALLAKLLLALLYMYAKPTIIADLFPYYTKHPPRERACGEVGVS